MSDNTKPTRLRSVELKPATAAPADLSDQRLHDIALLEITALNKRLKKRKTDKLHTVFEKAVFKYSMSRMKPRPADAPRPIDVFRQALTDAGITITYAPEKRASTYVRKNEHPRVRQRTGNGKRTREEEEVLRTAGILPRIVDPNAPPRLSRRELVRASQRAAAQADNDKSKD
jgi:hypothetical protein